ncbi:unnamed protein product [Cercopithifilaria johnstoni]|uniref:Uncharacterized protein n=1 Tax=Cercopithifilaria johnstoni TaxID=2874296 RepID=A0A8J2PZ91_9BILA|nr:unnamed protein product [Cercopithifilaria johnstoni]
MDYKAFRRSWCEGRKMGLSGRRRTGWPHRYAHVPVHKLDQAPNAFLLLTAICIQCPHSPAWPLPTCYCQTAL